MEFTISFIFLLWTASAGIVRCQQTAQNEELLSYGMTISGKVAAKVLDGFPIPIRRTASQIRVCFTNRSGQDAFLSGLTNGNNVIASVCEDSHCEATLTNITYKSGATYVLVGDRNALLRYMRLVKDLAANKTINISKTLWIFVSTGTKSKAFRSQLENLIPESLQMALLEFNTESNSRAYGKEAPMAEINQRERSRGVQRASVTGDIQVKRNSLLFQKESGQDTHLKGSFPRNIGRIPQNLGIHVYKAVSSVNGAITLSLAALWDRHSGLIPAKTFKETYYTNFQGRRIILTTLHKPRVFEIRRGDGSLVSSLDEVNGYVAEVIRVVGKHLNLTIDLIFTNTFGTALPNGSWSGMMGQLVGKEADLSPLDFSLSMARAQAVDFSEWFSTDDVVVVSQAAKPLTKPFLMLEIFSIWVWLSILGTGVLTGILLWVIDRIMLPFRGQMCFTSMVLKRNLRQTVGTTLKLFLNQGSRQWPHTWTGRSLSSCFFLVVISIIALYQGYIIAFLAVPRTGRPIDSAGDLMQRLDHIIPIVRKNTVYYRFILNFESYKPIAENFKFHQDSFLNTWDFFQLIHEGKYALIDTYSSGVGRAARFESRSQQCRFHISRNVLKTDLDLMTHIQNSVFRKTIDRKLRQMRSFGIIENIKKTFYSTSCERELGQRDPIALNISQVQSAFYLLCIGLLTGLLIFISEICFQSCLLIKM